MSKITVCTTSSIMLIDPSNGAEIEALTDTVVEHTWFISERIGLGQLRIVGEKKGQEALFGSSILPSEVELSATLTVPLGDVVRHAFEASGMTVKNWNALAEEHREERLAKAVEAMTPTPTPSSTDADGDGHHDKTGEFVEGNKVATKRKGRK